MRAILSSLSILIETVLRLSALHGSCTPHRAQEELDCPRLYDTKTLLADKSQPSHKHNPHLIRPAGNPILRRILAFGGISQHACPMIVVAHGSTSTAIHIVGMYGTAG